MHGGRTGIAFAAVATVVAGVLASAAEVAQAAEGWQATFLAKPDGWRGGWVSGTDGMGNYSGAYYDYGGNGPTMAVWHGGEVVSVAPPAGCLEASAVGETSAGVIAVATGGCGGENVSSPYTYSGGSYHALPVPDGYAGARTVAINASGAVLGSAAGPDGEATVVWPAAPAEPVVIPDTLPGQRAVDVDDGGDRILFQTDDGPYLWWSGTMTAVAVPSGWDEASVTAICGGLVAGYATRADETHAMVWESPDRPVPLQAGYGRHASGCNASGLVAGDLMTWRDTRTAGSLPIPPGYEEGAAAAVGEDGSVLGSVTFYADGGRQYIDPVVWRWS